MKISTYLDTIIQYRITQEVGKLTARGFPPDNLRTILPIINSLSDISPGIIKEVYASRTIPPSNDTETISNHLKEFLLETIGVQIDSVSQDDFKHFVDYLLLNFPKELCELYDDLLAADDGEKSPEEQDKLKSIKLHTFYQFIDYVLKNTPETIPQSSGMSFTVPSDRGPCKVQLYDNTPNNIFPTVKKIHNLANELITDYDTKKDDDTKISEDNAEKVFSRISTLINTGQLFLAQSLAFHVRNLVSDVERVEDFLTNIEREKTNVNIRGEIVEMDYSTPIPIFDQYLWIVHSRDLTQIIPDTNLDPEGYYLVNNASMEIIHLPKKRKYLLGEFGAVFNSRAILPSTIFISCTKDRITIDDRHGSYGHASNERLVAAHKLLKGHNASQGVINEYKNEFKSISEERKTLNGKIENLKKIKEDSFPIEDLKKLVIDILDHDEFIGIPKDALESLESTTQDMIRAKALTVCSRVENEPIIEDPTREVLTKSDFVNILNTIDLNDNANREFVFQVAHEVLQERALILKYYYEMTLKRLNNYNEALSSDEGLIGIEDEINRRLENTLITELHLDPDKLKFQINHDKSDDRSVSSSTEDDITTITLKPELVYTILRGCKFDIRFPFYSIGKISDYQSALNTIGCYL